MTRWRLVLEYDGAPFVGWAVQPNGRSIQGEVEGALAQLCQHPVRVAVAGRTDAGVHALGQVVAFDTDAERDADAIVGGVNAFLPPEVACVAAEVVAADFDPRRQARGKLYRYCWLNRRCRSPLRRAQVWHVPAPMDASAMAAAGQALVGEHDFTSFRAARCDARHPVRTIESLRVERRGDRVVLEVEGPGFLRHMVRIIAGTLLEVGLGRKPPAWVGDALAARSRQAAGRTAPPHGLTLVRVDYGAP